MSVESKGRDLFIVDNSVSGWTGLRYLEEWAGIAKAFDIATGYFEIGALLALNGKWQPLDKIRILMGAETTHRTRKALFEAASPTTTASSSPCMTRSMKDQARPGRLPKYLSQDELQRFFAAIPSPRDRALFAVIYHYGLRVDEATALTLEDLDLKSHRIRLRRLKNGLGGEKPLWRHTAKLLRAYLRVRRDAGPYLFTGREGPLKKRQIQNLFIRYATAAGISGRSVHALRHSIAVHLLDAGRRIEYVADHLGHRNIQNTRIYAQISHPLREQTFRELERHPKIVRIA